jgi:ribosomal protein S27E
MINPNSETGATCDGCGAVLVAAGFPACRITRLPAGCSWVMARAWIFVRCGTGGRDAARYVRQDACRYGTGLIADLISEFGINPKSEGGRDGALRRHHAVQARNCGTHGNPICTIPSAERGRGQRSALSLSSIGQALPRSSGLMNQACHSGAHCQSQTHNYSHFIHNSPLSGCSVTVLSPSGRSQIIGEIAKCAKCPS